MDPRIVKASLQAAVLSAISNIIGQTISCYRANRPFSINTTDLFHFALFSLLSCPPNYIWQTWLESTFPGYTEKTTSDKVKAIDNTHGASGYSEKGDKSSNVSLRQRADQTVAETDSKAPTEELLKSTKSGKTLNVRNTAIKFTLDQTFGAAINTVMFIAGIALLRGEDLESIMHGVAERFLPMITAGQKLWPAYSIISFTLIPVERRTVCGSIVGVFWGIILTLLSGEKK